MLTSVLEKKLNDTQQKLILVESANSTLTKEKNAIDKQLKEDKSLISELEQELEKQSAEYQSTNLKQLQKVPLSNVDSSRSSVRN